MTREEKSFILDALELEPSLYLDEIQSHLQAMTGEYHPLSTIHNKMKNHLHLTSKKARTVHPAQCPIKRAEYLCSVSFIPSSFLVFLGKSFYLLLLMICCLLIM